MNNENHRLLIDTPSKSPALGYNGYASAFADIIHKSSPQFSVGIFGGWGSGKTTLMQAIQEKLDYNQVIPVEFSAWRYEKEDHLIVPLLETVKEALLKWSKNQNKIEISEKAKSAGRTIGKVITSFLAGLSIKFGVPEAFELSYDASKALSKAKEEGQDEQSNSKTRSLNSLYFTCFTALKDAFDEFFGQNKKLRFVIFIDDLDRCLPNGVLQVLESMKLFFDLHGFIFVVGLDQDVVEWCIDRTYAEKQSDKETESICYQIRGAYYIKKIFQVPFALFPVSISQLDEFLEALINENELPESHAKEIRDKIKPHLSYVIDESGINPREIKRFINAYTLNMKIKPDLDSDAVLALKTISFRREWQVVQQALYTSGEVFQDSLKRQLNGNSDVLSGLNSLFGSIPQSFITYVSQDAPGHNLLSATPLDEYIRTGAATSSTGDPKLLDFIQTLGQTRGMITEATNEDSLRDATKRMGRSAMDFMQQADSTTKRIGPYKRAAVESVQIINKKLESAVNTYSNPEQWTQWKKEFDQALSDAIGLLVAYYQSGDIG